MMAEKRVIVCDSCGREVAEAEIARVAERTGRRGRPRMLELCPA